MADASLNFLAGRLIHIEDLLECLAEAEGAP